jgi:hypothetical protein
MEKPVTVQVADNAANGAIDLMAKLAVLIVAALLFAIYGIGEGRTQPLNGGAEPARQGKAERVAMLRRVMVDGRTAAAQPTARKVPAPLIERF